MSVNYVQGIGRIVRRHSETRKRKKYHFKTGFMPSCQTHSTVGHGMLNYGFKHEYQILKVLAVNAYVVNNA